MVGRGGVVEVGVGVWLRGVPVAVPVAVAVAVAVVVVIVVLRGE